MQADDPEARERLARLSAQADRAFGDAVFSRQWLRTSNAALGGAIPLDLARTEVGAAEVEAVLDRIARGDYA